jgi:hypothetical protein
VGLPAAAAGGAGRGFRGPAASLLGQSAVWERLLLLASSQSRGAQEGTP